jgi:hypothetical protein
MLLKLKKRAAFFICPVLKDEIEALRDGNTKVVLENRKLLDRLASDNGGRENG